MSNFKVFLDGAGIINAISAGVSDQTKINRQFMELMELGYKFSRQSKLDKYNSTMLDQYYKSDVNNSSGGAGNAGVDPYTGQRSLAGKTDLPAGVTVPSQGPTIEAPGITGQGDPAMQGKRDLPAEPKASDRLDNLTGVPTQAPAQAPTPYLTQGINTRATVIDPVKPIQHTPVNKLDQMIGAQPRVSMPTPTPTPTRSINAPAAPTPAAPTPAAPTTVAPTTVATRGASVPYYSDEGGSAQRTPLNTDRPNFSPLPTIPDTSVTSAKSSDRLSQVTSPEAARPAGVTDLREGILGTAGRLRMDPNVLATIMSYETGGTFDPTKRGPTTQYGQHEGLIQFGQPQQQQYGYDRNDPINSQLGEGGAVEKYFLDRGWKPGMSALDAYSIVNAGSPGRYNASDAGNGGAAGTVADKVAGMGDHAANARRFLGQSEQRASFKPVMPEILNRTGVKDSVRKLYSDMSSQFGVNFQVNSGHRDPEQNRKAGGAKGSQHIHGTAMDVQAAGMDPQKRQALLAWAMDNPEIGGIGRYPSGNLHFDTRPRVNGELAMWGAEGDYSADPGELVRLKAMTPEARRALYTGSAANGDTSGGFLDSMMRSANDATGKGPMPNPTRYAPRGSGSRVLDQYTYSAPAPAQYDPGQYSYDAGFGDRPQGIGFGFTPQPTYQQPQAPQSQQAPKTGVDFTQMQAPQADQIRSIIDVLTQLLSAGVPSAQQRPPEGYYYQQAPQLPAL